MSNFAYVFVENLKPISIDNRQNTQTRYFCSSFSKVRAIKSYSNFYSVMDN